MLRMASCSSTDHRRAHTPPARRASSWNPRWPVGFCRLPQAPRGVACAPSAGL